MYWVRKMVVPNNATPTAMLAMTARTTVRLPNSDSGMIGSSTRDSTSTASASSAIPPSTISVVCQDPQAKLWPASETQMSRLETPAVMSTAPR